MFVSTTPQQVTMGRGCHQVFISFITCHLIILDLLLTMALPHVFCCHSWTWTPAALQSLKYIHHQNSFVRQQLCRTGRRVHLFRCQVTQIHAVLSQHTVSIKSHLQQSQAISFQASFNNPAIYLQSLLWCFSSIQLLGFLVLSNVCL